MGRRAMRIVLWTTGWTLYQWWAVFGWPDSLEGSFTALMMVSAGSILGFTAWHALGRRIDAGKRARA